MASMIRHDPFAPPSDPSLPSRAEIDTFNAIKARAKAQAAATSA